MNRYIKDIVIVVDLGQYKSSYQESVPFKAIVVQVHKDECVLYSLATDKEYTVYHSQILETMDIEEIKTLLDVRSFGEYTG